MAKEFTFEVTVIHTFNVEVEDDFDIEEDGLAFIEDYAADNESDNEQWEQVTAFDNESFEEYAL